MLHFHSCLYIMESVRSNKFRKRPKLREALHKVRGKLLRSEAMPLDSISSSARKAQKNKRSSIVKYMRNVESDSTNYLNSSFRSDVDGDTGLPPIFRGKLHDLFAQIEKEFEALYSENVQLHSKLDALNEKLEKAIVLSDKPPETNESDVSVLKSNKKSGGGQKLKTAHKLKAQTSKIVSSFKGSSSCCSVVREYFGHKDGIWDVGVARHPLPILGTASADRSAFVWNAESGRCLLRYVGHTGSVNSIRFHPYRDLVLTSSGDKSTHVWQAAVNIEHNTQRGGGSSDEDIVDYEREEEFFEKTPSLRTPVSELSGHSNVVIYADWLAGGDSVVTASWDRTANLYDVETGDMIHSLTGHDAELTHTNCHPSQKLIVTSSEDTTFRLWDFRDPIHSVSVFQGHTHTVNSAVFSKKDDKVVSGSDDRTVKVWDLRNMRSALATIRSDAAVNRLGVSVSGLIAIPLDNRQIRLHDLSGQRVARLPRSSRQGHHRMVCSVAWSEEVGPCSFYSAGFDRLTLGWALQNLKES